MAVKGLERTRLLGRRHGAQLADAVDDVPSSRCEGEARVPRELLAELPVHLVGGRGRPAERRRKALSEGGGRFELLAGGSWMVLAASRRLGAHLAHVPQEGVDGLVRGPRVESDGEHLVEREVRMLLRQEGAVAVLPADEEGGDVLRQSEGKQRALRGRSRETRLPPAEDEGVDALPEVGGRAPVIVRVACAWRAALEHLRRAAHVPACACAQNGARSSERRTRRNLRAPWRFLRGDARRGERTGTRPSRGTGRPSSPSTPRRARTRAPS